LQGETSSKRKTILKKPPDYNLVVTDMSVSEGIKGEDNQCYQLGKSKEHISALYLLKSCDIKNKLKPRICSVYYDLKCGIEPRFLKNTTSGSNIASLPSWLPKRYAGRPATNQYDIPLRLKISFEKP